MSEDKKWNSPKCSICNYRVPDLVPMYDNDQAHKKQMLCVFCKRKIKKGLPITKFKRTVEEEKENE